MELILLVIQVVFGISMIPLTLIIGGKNGVQLSILVALVDMTLAIADFASGPSITNTLLCSNCGTANAYPTILLPIALTVLQFLITITKDYP